MQGYIDGLVAFGEEVGLQVAVFRCGEPVVDAVAGLAEPDTGRPVTPGTLFYAASTAKGIAATAVHVLMERGELPADLRVADVWPAFGAHGKQRTTLRHVLLHTAGVPAPPYDTTIEDLCDWEGMCEALADAEPWWEPGTRFGYHALTFGFLLGEIVRRATGRTLSAWLRDVVTAPLGVGDEVFFGVPEALLGRVARQAAPVGWKPERPAPGSPVDRALPPGVQPDAAYANRREVLVSDIPSGGTMTARGAARIYAALLGHIDGASLVSPDRLRDMAEPKFTGHDEIMGMTTSWAYGYAPHRPSGLPSRPGSSFGMVGMNGSAAYADIDSGVAVALMRNRYGPPAVAAAAEVDRLVAEAFGPEVRR